MKKIILILIILFVCNITYSQQCYGYNCHKRSKGHKLISTVCVVLLFAPVALGIIDYQINKK